MCRSEFDISDDGREAHVWLGDRAETVFESHLDRFNIYLGRDSYRWQFMYSGWHEAFHRVCGGRKNSAHWADEMFAVMFSLLYLEHIGEAEHADRNRAGLVKEAERISRSEMLTVIGGRLPEGLYGQAYLAGEELRQIPGWDAMKSLAVLRTSEGFPDVTKWLTSLSPGVYGRATQVVQALP
jgi:hypothetical protein